ncbi:UNVERIFIED_CONTAM: hypothetical protein HDU68_004665 [Siphonaria sp. JEL0065]|nr:hypothetical protein HDU68_004665 [Siphonaria sp. JEL0065]
MTPTPALPRELWEHILHYSCVPEIIRLRQASQSFRSLADPANTLLWKRKAHEINGGFSNAFSPRLLKGETYFDVVRKFFSWKTSPTRIKAAKVVQTNHTISSSLPHCEPETRRFLVAEPISHRVLIRWCLSGPLAFYHKDPVLKIVDLTSMLTVVIDARLERLRFSYAVPHSNWVVYKDTFGEYQLGYYNHETNSLDFVDSVAFCDVVAEILTTSGNGQIIPMRGYGDFIVIGVKSQPTGNEQDTKIKLSAIRLTVVQNEDGTSLEASANIHWTQSVPYVRSLFVDNHDAYMIFRYNDALFDFKVVSIRCGTILAGDAESRASDLYQQLSQHALYMTCSRFHLLATLDNVLKVCKMDGQSLVTNFSVSTGPTAGPPASIFTRTVISDDASLVVGISTMTSASSGTMKYDFSMNVTDICSGAVEQHLLSQSSGVLNSGVYVVCEDLKDGNWSRQTAFIALK